MRVARNSWNPFPGSEAKVEPDTHVVRVELNKASVSFDG